MQLRNKISALPPTPTPQALLKLTNNDISQFLSPTQLLPSHFKKVYKSTTGAVCPSPLACFSSHSNVLVK